MCYVTASASQNAPKTFSIFILFFANTDPSHNHYKHYRTIISYHCVVSTIIEVHSNYYRSSTIKLLGLLRFVITFFPLHLVLIAIA